MSDLPRITETWHWNEGNYAAGESPYMGRSKFGKWVTVEHAADIIVEYQHRLAAAEAEREAWCASYHAAQSDVRSVEAKLAAAKAELRLAAEINEAALDDRIDAYQKLTAAEAAIHELEESVSALESERNALGAKLSVETHENNRWEGICDEMEAKLATADALLREAREAFRVGVASCCLPKNRLVYLPERWDEQAKDVCE